MREAAATGAEGRWWLSNTTAEFSRLALLTLGGVAGGRDSRVLMAGWMDAREGESEVRGDREGKYESGS